ncbi:MAG: DUF1501 domain-containing protein [Planctomycetaceae bacterium]|nr:DUF1501 domain-containing protein [Planctomycetaceae bacterium]MCB9950680.1 DUF1501 domain-containing protein [Planctomycetaceae bacterium]
MSMLNQQFGTALPRRSLLQAGACSLLGLGLPQLLSHQAVASAGGSFGAAKRCIFIFLWGGPSHIDTLDPKPEAPTDIRGSFSPINTSVPGVQVSELLPNIAQRMHDVAVIRSLNHTDPAHLSSAHAALTGQLAPVPRSDAEPPSERDAPHIGSVVARLRSAPRGLPGFVTMPWIAYHPAAPGGQAPGQRAGWLGHNYDPMLVEGDPSQNQWRVPALQLQDALSAERLSSRMQLLTDLDAQRAALNASASGLALNGFQQQATELLTSPRVREAFSIDQETEETRNRYGRNIHGQCVLLARRLSERGVPLVCVNWHNDGQNFWDTHGNNFNRLKNDLCPPSDQALGALIDDLKSRGLFEETAIAWVGEFGRSPKINGSAGREHHPFCFSGLLAGAGIRGGSVFGTSDSQGAYPASDPVSQHDYMATLLHVLGVSAEATLADREDRPHRLYAGNAVRDILRA